MASKPSYKIPALVLVLIILCVFLFRAAGCGKEAMSPDFWYTIAPHTNKMAWVEKEGDKFRIMVDGQPVGELFDAVITMPIFSPDGNSIAYIAQNGAMQCAMVNGKQVGEAYERIDEITWAPDSKLIAYFAWKGSEKFVVKNGEVVGGPFITVNGHRFGTTSEIYAFAGTTLELELVLTLGDRVIRRDDVHAWDITGDGKDIYHTLRTQDKGWVLMRNDTDLIAEYVDELAICRTVPSIVYTVVKDSGAIVIRDGKQVGGNYFWATKPVFSPNGVSMAFAASDGKPLVVLDGKPIRPQGEVENIEGIYFSPDNKSVAYAAKSGQFWYVYKNDLRVSDAFEQVLPLMPNQDGKKIVFAGLKKGKTKKIEIPW